MQFLSLLTTPLFLLSHSLLTYFSHLKSLVFICVRVIMCVSVHDFGGQRQPRVLVLNLHLALRLFDCSLLCTPAHLAHKLPRMFLPLPLHIWPQVHKGHRHALLTDFHVGLAVYHVSCCTKSSLPTKWSPCPLFLFDTWFSLYPMNFSHSCLNLLNMAITFMSYCDPPFSLIILINGKYLVLFHWYFNK